MICKLIKCDGVSLYRCVNCNRLPVEISMFPVELECTGEKSQCKELGLQVSTSECNHCGKGRIIPIIVCGVFGLCTTDHVLNNTPCCRQCGSYTPA